MSIILIKTQENKIYMYVEMKEIFIVLHSLSLSFPHEKKFILNHTLRNLQ
jgi:hypothetical protein